MRSFQERTAGLSVEGAFLKRKNMDNIINAKFPLGQLMTTTNAAEQIKFDEIVIAVMRHVLV